jgi:prepilin signal peptidase PulO-like enzyme (type II secretory pathway)
MASYVGLGGRCRTCRGKIPLSALLWDAGGAALGMALAATLLAFGTI